MSEQRTTRGDSLGPFLAALDGTPVATVELVDAGRRLARALVRYGRPVILCSDDRWAGVWDLERLSDDEAVSWGLWVAMKVRRFEDRQSRGREDRPWAG
jgi:hypothetical protein